MTTMSVTTCETWSRNGRNYFTIFGFTYFQRISVGITTNGSPLTWEGKGADYMYVEIGYQTVEKLAREWYSHSCRVGVVPLFSPHQDSGPHEIDIFRFLWNNKIWVPGIFFRFTGNTSKKWAHFLQVSTDLLYHHRRYQLYPAMRCHTTKKYWPLP